MEREEFIQRLFISAMANPQIVGVGETIKYALEEYDKFMSENEELAGVYDQLPHNK